MNPLKALDRSLSLPRAPLGVGAARARIFLNNLESWLMVGHFKVSPTAFAVCGLF